MGGSKGSEKSVLDSRGVYATAKPVPPKFSCVGYIPNSSGVRRHKGDQLYGEMAPYYPVLGRRQFGFGHSHSVMGHPGFKSDKKRRIRKTPSSITIGGLTSLPVEIVFLILDKLLEQLDHVRFAAVCKGLRSFSKAYNHRTQRWPCKVLPMLLNIPEECLVKTCLAGPALYSIPEGKIYDDICLQVPFGKKIRCSSSSWLPIYKIAGMRLTISLQNPFRTEKSFCLPPLSVLRRWPDKVVFSADPILNPDNYDVVALLSGGNEGQELAIIKKGQKSWTMIRVSGRLDDLIFYKGEIYGAQYWTGRIVSFDPKGNKYPSPLIPNEKLLTPKMPFDSIRLSPYLVESTKGDLLHILRCFSECSQKHTTKFVVYKWEYSDKDRSLVNGVEVKSIGDEALFVGDNQSVSVLASNFPGCCPNSIYYTHDPVFSCSQKCDIGIFNLEDGTITHCAPRFDWQSAIWVMPPFEGHC